MRHDYDYVYVLYRYQLHDIAIGLFLGWDCWNGRPKKGVSPCLRPGPICDPTPGGNGLNLGGKWWLILRLGYLVHGEVSARHLYVVCIYGAICLQIQKYFSPDPTIFSQKSKILILLYVVSKLKQKNSRFRGKTARYYVLKFKFVDISHHRYKLRRDIE